MAPDGSLERAHSPEGLLEDAGRVLERERRHLADERSAFARFRDRLEGLDPDASLGEARARTVRDDRGVSRVREAYAETVMAVPHYRERFDEPFGAHVAGELSPELAVALGRDDRLRPYLKRSLSTAVDAAIRGRTTLLAVVADEREDLEALADRLEGIDAEREAIVGQPIDRMEFNALRLSRRRLRGLAERCDELAGARQTTIREGRRFAPGTGDELGEYLYADCASGYPFLSAIAATGRRIDRGLAAVDERLVAVGG